MERERVESGNIHSVGMEGNTLQVQFRSGAVYDYADVPGYVYVALMCAESKGSYFHNRIKPNYTHTRLPDEPLIPPVESGCFAGQSESGIPDSNHVTENQDTATMDNLLDAYPVDRFRSAFSVVKHKRRD